MKPSPTEFGEKLGRLIDKFDQALAEGSTAQAQNAAFALGCEVLSDLVTLLTATDSPLKKVEEASDGYVIGVPRDKVQLFLERERQLLEELKIKSPKGVQKLVDAFARKLKQGLEAAQFDSKETVQALTQLRDLLCEIEVYTTKAGVSVALVATCADVILDAGMVGADVVGLAVSTTTGWGFAAAAWLAVTSVRAGVKGLREKVAKVQGQFNEDKLRHRKKENPPPRL
jgi:hypothetical protein